MRFTAYDQEVMLEASVHSADQRNTREQHVYTEQPMSLAFIQQLTDVTLQHQWQHHQHYRQM